MKKNILIISTIALATFASSLAWAGGNRYSKHRETIKKMETPAVEMKRNKESAAKVPINDVYVIHFILDGTNLKAFNRAMDEGRMPNVKKLFVDNGAIFENGLSLFPSTSSTIYQSYTTGLFSGNAGIPHLQRFERNRWQDIDYLTISNYETLNADLINLRALMNPDIADLNAPTSIFELLSGHPTAAVYSSFYRGASSVHPTVPIRALWATYVSGREEHVDVLACRKVLDLFEGDIEDVPRYSLVGLYSSDVDGHLYGPESDEVQQILRQFDLFLKEFRELLDRRGIAGKTYIILSADHGMHMTGKLFNLQKKLEAKGFDFKPKNPNEKNYTIFAADRGVVSSHIYVKHDGGFKPIDDPAVLRKVPTRSGEPADLIKAILDLDATEFVIARAGDRKAKIFSYDDKSAEINCFNIDYTDYCSYQFDPSAGDPLGYSSNGKLRHLLDGKPHSTLAWKEATSGETFPDAVINLSQVFYDGRAGDAFITTRGRYGFRKVKAGNHGGIIDEDMRVPILIAGPTVPRGKFGTARPMDIYPLLLEWFDLHVPDRNYDGVNPFRKNQLERNDYSELAALEGIFEKEPPILKMIDVPRFVREKIIPAVPASRFSGLVDLAKMEMKRRLDMLSAMNKYLGTLQKQKEDDEAPKVVQERYLDDHIDIVKRAIDRTRKGMMLMEDIDKVMINCSSPDSVSCHGL